MDTQAPLVTAPRRGKQIVGLDALRLAAALMVLAYHLYFFDWTSGGPAIHTHQFDFLEPFVWFGWSGVEIFFTISGFVIAYSASAASASTFLQHRLTRLFPTAILCASLTTLVLRLDSHAAARYLAVRWFNSSFFIPGPLIDGVYWTLTIELGFYAIVYVLLLLKRFDRLPLVMAILGGLSTLYWIIVFASDRLPSALRPVAAALRFIGDRPHTLIWHGCYFTLGVFLWLCLFDRVTAGRITVMAVCTIAGVLQIIHRSNTLSTETGYRFHPILPVILWLATLAFIPLATCNNHFVQRLLGSAGMSVLRTLGLMTYPLYLLHQEIGRALIQRTRLSLGTLPSLAIGTVFVIVLALVVTLWLEPPLRNAIKRVLPARG